MTFSPAFRAHLLERTVALGDGPSTITSSMGRRSLSMSRTGGPMAGPDSRLLSVSGLGVAVARSFSAACRTPVSSSLQFSQTDNPRSTLFVSTQVDGRCSTIGVRIPRSTSSHVPQGIIGRNSFSPCGSWGADSRWNAHHSPNGRIFSMNVDESRVVSARWESACTSDAVDGNLKDSRTALVTGNGRDLVLVTTRGRRLRVERCLAATGRADLDEQSQAPC